MLLAILLGPLSYLIFSAMKIGCGVMNRCQILSESYQIEALLGLKQMTHSILMWTTFTASDLRLDCFRCLLEGMLGPDIARYPHLTVTTRTIAARHAERATSKVGLTRAVDSDSLDDGYVPDSKSENGVSRPDVNQLFNIFYPSDPISYRLEPLIAQSMASVKPHNLPYTKKGLFGVVGSQGLTGIGTKVGQSVSGLFASLSTGISSNLLPASLRITNEEAQMMLKERQPAATQIQAAENQAAGQKEASEIPVKRTKEMHDDEADERLLADQSSHFATLYSRFQMNDEPNTKAPMDFETDGKDDTTRKQRIAQRKVWALNRNGRVDFSIQE